jgi:hypothetical protein
MQAFQDRERGPIHAILITLILLSVVPFIARAHGTQSQKRILRLYEP